MIKRFFVLAVLVVLSGCGSKSMLKLAGAVESLNKDLVESNKALADAVERSNKANQALAKSNLALSNSVAKDTNVNLKLLEIQTKETKRKAEKDAEKKANEEAKKNRPWYVRLID